MDNDLELQIIDSENPKRDNTWYIYFGIITIILIAISALLKNYTFTAIVILSAGLLIIRTQRGSSYIKLTIKDGGIEVDGKIYEYEGLESFSIHEREGKNYFTFKKKNSYSPIINSPIGDPLPIRTRLNNLLPEVEYQESFIETLERVLKI